MPNSACKNCAFINGNIKINGLLEVQYQLKHVNLIFLRDAFQSISLKTHIIPTLNVNAFLRIIFNYLGN